MRIRVHHDIGDLANDLLGVAAKAQVQMPEVVRRNGEQGNRVAQGIAKAAAGPHGKDYWKRLSSEMVGPLTAEYGPEGPPKTDYVGVSGTVGAMRDLTKSARIQAPRFAEDVRDMADGLFW